MSLLFMDGFQHVDTTYLGAKWDNRDGSTNTAYHRNSQTQSYRPNGDPDSTFRTYKYVGDRATLIVGMAVYIAAATTGQILGLLDSGTRQVYLEFDAGVNRLRFYRHGGVLLGVTPNNSIVLNAWQYVELAVTIDNAAGAAEVKINGVSQLSLAGVDTQNTANASANQVCLGGLSGSVLNVTDLYVLDTAGAVNNAFLGDVTIATLMPSGAGNYSQWTPKAGSNYENVDEKPPDGDTTYNSTGTPGLMDSFDFQALTLTGTIKGIQVAALVRKDDAGSHTARLLTRSGGADYFGSAASLTDSYKYILQIRETDPDTAAAWSVAGLNAAEFGVDLVS